MVPTGAVIDDLSSGVITKALDSRILNHLDLHVGTGNLNATRLSVAGLYLAAVAVHIVRANRRFNRINHMELLAVQEVQSDRLATDIELNAEFIAPNATLREQRKIIPQ